MSNNTVSLKKKKMYAAVPSPNKKETTTKPIRLILISACCFLLGCILTASLILTTKINTVSTLLQNNHPYLDSSSLSTTTTTSSQRDTSVSEVRRAANTVEDCERTTSDTNNNEIGSILRNIKILVVIVSFDFAQLPHLEEVLGAYHDVCVTGAAKVDIVIHATVPYPVTLIDLLNSRIICENFTIQIVLKPKSLKLFLVDEHRKVFYDNIDNYDLFIYTEDDIRVTPTTIATYLYETRYIERTLSKNGHQQKLLQPSDFNVGIVRYEYNYPPNVLIDDKTRHATQNTTRVYWEHGFKRPVVGHAVEHVKQHPVFDERYFTMKNHHQGMFLATRQLLLDWQVRKGCDFANARMRPGKKHQPSEGTQRVWMSSQMLFGKRHCGVQQVLPKDKFGTLTVFHLPNKNYRRVGKYRTREFSDGTEFFEPPHESLMTEMEMHIATEREWPSKPQIPYRGIRMIDEVNHANDRTPLLERRMREFEDYAKRGGVLSEDDWTKIELVEDA